MRNIRTLSKYKIKKDRKIAFGPVREEIQYKI